MGKPRGWFTMPWVVDLEPSLLREKLEKGSDGWTQARTGFTKGKLEKLGRRCKADAAALCIGVSVQQQSILVGKSQVRIEVRE